MIMDSTSTVVHTLSFLLFYRWNRFVIGFVVLYGENPQTLLFRTPTGRGNR